MKALLAAGSAAAALILGGGVAHADPSTPLDPSDVQCYPGAIYCPPPRYSQWSRFGGNEGDCHYFAGAWYSITGPCNGSRS